MILKRHELIRTKECLLFFSERILWKEKKVVKQSTFFKIPSCINTRLRVKMFWFLCASVDREIIYEISIFDHCEKIRSNHRVSKYFDAFYLQAKRVESRRDWLLFFLNTFFRRYLTSGNSQRPYVSRRVRRSGTRTRVGRLTRSYTV